MNSFFEKYDKEVLKNILKTITTIIITIVVIKESYSSEIYVILGVITLVIGLNQITNKFIALRELNYKVSNSINELLIDIVKIIFLIGGILYGIGLNNNSLTVSLLVMINLINLISLIKLIKLVGIKTKENSIKEYIKLRKKSNLEKTRGIEIFNKIGIPNEKKFHEKSKEVNELLNKMELRKNIINNTYNFLFVDSIEKYFEKKEIVLLNIIKNTNIHFHKSFIEKYYNKFTMVSVFIILMVNYTKIFNLRYLDSKGGETIIASIIVIAIFLGFIIVYEMTKSLKNNVGKIGTIFFFSGIFFKIEIFLSIHLINIIYNGMKYIH